MEKRTDIDAVRMVRRIRDANYDRLKGATREERIAFYNGPDLPAASPPASPPCSPAGPDRRPA